MSHFIVTHIVAVIQVLYSRLKILGQFGRGKTKCLTQNFSGEGGGAIALLVPVSSALVIIITSADVRREIIIISAFGWMRMQGASEPLLWKLITADDCFDESADTCSTTTSIYGVAYM